MNFSEALHLLRNHKKVARSGWNGKSMYIFLLEFGPITVPGPTWDIGHFQLEPCICMFTAQGKFQPGWLASQPDMLANDWVEVE